MSPLPHEKPSLDSAGLKKSDPDDLKSFDREEKVQINSLLVSSRGNGNQTDVMEKK